MFSILFFDPTARKMQQKQITVVSISEIKKYQLEKLRLHDVKKLRCMFLFKVFHAFSNNSLYELILTGTANQLAMLRNIFLVKTKRNGKLTNTIFLSANWLPHGQLWAIIEGTASLTQLITTFSSISTRNSPGVS